MASTRRDFIKQLAVGATAALTSAAFSNLSTPNQAGAQAAMPKNLFILGWDGAGLNNVLPMLNDGKLPNLNRFISKLEGKLCPIQLTGYTATVTSWAQAFTGLTHDQTGVLGNWKHDLSTGLVKYPRGLEPFHPEFMPKNGIYTNAVWYDEIPYNHSILKPIQDLGYKIGFFVSKVLLANSEEHPFRDIGASIDECKLYAPNVGGEFSTRESEIDDDYLPWLRYRAFKFMESNKRHLTFLHLDPDVYGHKYGEQGERYREEFVRCDRVLGQLLKRIDRNTTSIMVISDHGFNPGGFSHTSAPDAWMATDLAVHPIFVHKRNQKAFGTMRDVAHTIIDHFGIPLSTMPVQMRGVSMLA